MIASCNVCATACVYARVQHIRDYGGAMDGSWAWAQSFSAEVARGLRFCDSEAKSHCVAEAAVHLFGLLPRFDPARGVPIGGWAYPVVRRRMMRLARMELRARTDSRIRAMPAGSGLRGAVAAKVGAPLIQGEQDKKRVKRLLDELIEKAGCWDGEAAGITRDVLVRVRVRLVGAPVRAPRRNGSACVLS